MTLYKQSPGKIVDTREIHFVMSSLRDGKRLFSEGQRHILNISPIVYKQVREKRKKVIRASAGLQ